MFWLAALVIVCLAANNPAQSDETQPSTPAPVSFTKEVAPILVQKCQACHGAADPKGDYQLTSFELLLKPGASSSSAITPGKMPARYSHCTQSGVCEKDLLTRQVAG